MFPGIALCWMGLGGRQIPPSKMEHKLVGIADVWGAHDAKGAADTEIGGVVAIETNSPMS
jgi:hypothetical protein